MQKPSPALLPFTVAMTSAFFLCASSSFSMNNRTLLCPHNGLLFMPTIAWEVEPNPALVMITEEEWVTVQEMFTVDVEIRVDRENLASGPVLTSFPAPCTICVASRH